MTEPTFLHLPRPASTGGFTLVELIAVILIVAALAVGALPRIVDLTDEAHHASVAATAAAFQNAVYLANLACVIRDFDGLDNLPGFGAGDLDFNANCFPSSTSGNNSLTVNGNRCIQIWNGLLLPAPSISLPANDSTAFRSQGGGTTCTFTYRNDADTLRRFTYNSATGVITTINP